MPRGKSIVVGIAALGLLLTGCGGDEAAGESAADSAPTTQETSEQNGSSELSENQQRMADAEGANTDAFWEETCPGQVATTEDEGPVLFQGAMEVPATEEVRLWQYSKLTETGQPVKFIEPGEPVCVQLVQDTEKFSYQNKPTIELWQVKHPLVSDGEAYIDTDVRPHFLEKENTEYMSEWTLREDLTPLEDAKESPVVSYKTCRGWNYGKESCE